MERRQFLSWVSVGMLASSLPIVLAACGAGSDTATDETTPTEAPKLDTAVRADGFQALATVEQIEVGPVVDMTNTAEPVLMFRDPDTAALVALNPKCTHQACIVSLDNQAKELHCACHGAKFKLDGSLIAGPAAKPLPIYDVKEEAGFVLVKVS